jgi:hypothetical protein
MSVFVRHAEALHLYKTSLVRDRRLLSSLLAAQQRRRAVDTVLTPIFVAVARALLSLSLSVATHRRARVCCVYA